MSDRVNSICAPPVIQWPRDAPTHPDRPARPFSLRRRPAEKGCSLQAAQVNAQRATGPREIGFNL